MLQLNAQNIFRKKPELENKFLDYNIILISEIWLTNFDRFLIKKFDINLRSADLMKDMVKA